MISLPRLIDNNGDEVRRIHPVSLAITENIVPLSTAEMSLLPGDSIPYRSFVELFTVNGSVGFYRAKTPSVGFGDVVNDVQLEHGICEVGDYIIKDSIEQTSMTLEDALLATFDHYDGSRWQMGTVSVEADVVFSADHSNVLQTINSLIEQVPNAMMTFDFSTTPWTWNVVEKESTVSAEGRLSRNISSVTIQRNDNDLCTRLWVKNLAVDPAESYMDADTIDTYGVIEKWTSDEYTQEQAEIVATNYLEKHKHPRYSVNINGLDLSSITGESLDRFQIGKKLRLIVHDLGETIEENIVRLDWGDVYGASTFVIITLSDEEKDSSVSIISGQSTAINGNNGISEKLNKDYSDFETALNRRYTKQFGVDITSDGIDIHGTGRELKLRAGGVLAIDLDEFSIDSVTGNIVAKEYHGAVSRDETDATNLNTLVIAGHYFGDPSTMTNKPAGLVSEVADIEVIALGAEIIVQRLTNSTSVYIRRSVSGTWGNWYRYDGTVL